MPTCGKKLGSHHGSTENHPRSRDKGKKSDEHSKAKISVTVISSLFALSLIAFGIFLMVREKNEVTGPLPDSTKVTLDNFQHVKPGMGLNEVETILGGSRPSSEKDIRDTARKGRGKTEAAVETGWSGLDEGTEWRRWDGRNLRVWVAFNKTKDGQQAAFSTAIELHGPTYQQHEGFATPASVHALGELAGQQKTKDTNQKK